MTKNLVEKGEEESQEVMQMEGADGKEEEEEEGMCRICHADAQPVSSLVSPCRCSGTMAYVHSVCLREWVLRRGVVQCELCGHKFQAHFEQRLVSRRQQILLCNMILKRLWRRFLLEMWDMYRRKVIIFSVVPFLCSLTLLLIYLAVKTDGVGLWLPIFTSKTVRNASCFFTPSSVGLYAITLFSSVGLAVLRAINPEPCSTVLSFFSASIVLSFMVHAIVSHTGSGQYHLSSEGQLVQGPAPPPVIAPVAASANASHFNVTTEDYIYKLAAGVSLQLPIPLARFYALAFFVSLLVLVYPLYRVVVNTRLNMRVHLSYITFENYSKSEEATKKTAEAPVAQHCSNKLESQGDDGVEGAMGEAARQVAVQIEGEGDNQNEDRKSSELPNGKP